MYMWPHYKYEKLDSFKDVRDIFPKGKCNDLNWFFLGHGGVHGGYMTLPELERGTWEDGRPMEQLTANCLIVHPRLVVIRAGEVGITREDLPFIRSLLESMKPVMNEEFARQGILEAMQ